ncbi:MAG: PEP-CTERM sorting domain-containing protein [Myxococcales bacterium]|nr:PEP-CTERM sorting domain-containing protein [Myxococcales bacterium]
MPKRTAIIAALPLLALLAAPTVAEATSFTDQWLNISYQNPGGNVIAQTNAYVTPPSTSVPFLLGFLDITLGADTIRITSNFPSDFNSSGAFDGLVFKDAFGQISEIAGVSIVSSNMVGLTATDLAYGAEFVSIDFDSLGFLEDTFVELSVEFIPTPEPATAAMVGLGLVILGSVGRRRRA